MGMRKDDRLFNELISANIRIFASLVDVDNDGDIAYTDHWVGWFLEQVTNAGLMENTAIVLFADHGEGFWEHDHCGHVTSVYDEVLHVPVIMALPVPNNSSVRIKQQIASADIFATLLDILNLPIDCDLDSHSLLPLLQDDTQKLYTRKYVSSELRFVEIEQESETGKQIPVERLFRSIRSQKDKYIAANRRLEIQSATPALSATAGEEELYDLTVDPGEKNNLATALSETTQQMRKIYQDFFAAFGVNVNSSPTKNDTPAQTIGEDSLEALKTLGYL